MSAILGRIALDGRPVEQGAFRAALDRLAHYGGDGTGMAVEGAVALGQHHRRVRRGRAADSQPLREGALTVVADAILDNRAELIRALDLAAEASGLSDTGLILRAFRKWDSDTPRHLLGDFAFALWDADKRRLFLARDHIGARPLYWALRRGNLVFATDIYGLLGFSDLDWQIDEVAVARYLMQPDIPPPAGFLRDLSILGPGRCVEIRGESVRETVWWDPHAIAQTGKTNGDDARHLRALIDEAVACRIDTERPVGAHLSGGVDSTAVTVLAARQLGAEGRALRAAYSWSPPVSADYPDIGPTDERRRINAVCTADGIDCRFLEGDIVETLDAWLRRPIEIEGTADLYEELAVIDRASQDGVGVMLSGWGGDEAASAHGFGYLAQLIRRGRLLAAVNLARRRTGGFRRVGPLLGTLARHGLLPLMPDALAARFSGHPEIYPEACFMSDALRTRADLPPRRTGPLVREIADPNLYLRRLIAFGHLAVRMRTWCHWGAAAGITYRYPLTDRRLLDFLLSLPAERLCARGSPRALMRAALADVLPAKMPKADPVQHMLRDRTRRAFWQRLQSGLDELPAVDCPWIDAAKLRARVAQMPADEIGRAMAIAELSGALRIAHLYRRWSAGSR